MWIIQTNHKEEAMKKMWFCRPVIFLLLTCAFAFCSRPKNDLLQTGMAKHKLGDYKGAIDDYTKAIELDSKNVDAYGARGYARRMMGDLTGAMDDYEKVIALDPKNSNGYAGRGLTRIKIGDKDNGCKDLGTARDLGYPRGADLVKENCEGK
jgi:tetratricopeptide (TPR) repeat protein